MAYYVQRTVQDDKGRYEVHHYDCGHKPTENAHTFQADNDRDAMNKAPYKPADGCWYCMQAYHEG
jgi:hypothetical protein